MTSEACHSVPTVVPKEYTPKGNYETFAGLKTYITGPSTTNPKIGIIAIYDIFGISPQTLQGADLLSSATQFNDSAVVLVPDFFNGSGVQFDWIPTDTEEKKLLFGTFMAQKAGIEKSRAALLEVVGECKAKLPTVEHWGVYGLCWGGKIAVFVSGSESPFDASAQAHPARMDRADAESLTIPHMTLASKDEPVDLVKVYADVVRSNGIGGHVETYSTMWHGWMGARADLEGLHSRAEFERGYGELAEFFGSYLRAT
ncbi:uncharacterized protein PV07_09272 [Cladophialophora immunda]|uniref:Dienelactone hydrolase domain-containing protein n=1 Tax=Cladophialophora immunda TaxID=569365 RepID=A0A0D2AM32_9EURO|nr:uncharacterized protein PV07_09272 [Cladophialophora immunda]KIW26152.1 hypothetical protein PV07_09272 [Cladophialophora immunda]